MLSICLSTVRLTLIPPGSGMSIVLLSVLRDVILSMYICRSSRSVGFTAEEYQLELRGVGL